MTRAQLHTCSSTATSPAHARTSAGCCAASERYSRSARAGTACYALAAAAPRRLQPHVLQAAAPCAAGCSPMCCRHGLLDEDTRHSLSGRRAGVRLMTLACWSDTVLDG